MPDYWLDADSFIRPYREFYRFQTVPQFWDFLKEKAQEGVIGSPELVLDKELSASDPKEQDALEQWARPLKDVLFLKPSATVQASYKQVVQYVEGNKTYKRHWVVKFLDGADPWVIAYAKALGGRIVGFETCQPNAKRPKLPDVAANFGVKCINLWDMLDELGWHT
ncbi:MAG: DUF4411 family protein [Chloroflexota bacterium]